MTQIIVNILISSILYSLIAYSFYLIYRSVGFFHIAHAMSITLGAYFTHLFYIELEVSIYAAMIIAISTNVFLFLIINKFLYQKLLLRDTSNWQMLVVSIGIYVILQNIISIFWGNGTISIRNWNVKKGNSIFEAFITNEQLISIFVALFLILLTFMFLEKTKLGTEIKAVASNSELASLFGINQNRAVIWSFIIGTILASSGGILIALDTDITPNMGFNWLLYSVVAMVIGGIGNMKYILIGSLLLATSQHFAAYFFNSSWMSATAFIMLIAFLYFQPYGISGKLIKKTKI